jgi:hypothetical protein
VTLLPTVDTATPEQISEAVQSFLNGTAAISTRNVRQAVKAARPQRHAHGAAPQLSLTPTSEEALAQARSIAPQLPFSLEYPRVRNAYAGAEPDALRLYDIHDRQGHLHPIYVIAIDRGGLGEYYDVQGSTWTDPPLLDDPSQTIQNTLTNSIQPREMLAMAEQTLPVVSPHPSSAQATGTIPTLRSVKLPPREVDVISLTSKIEAALGFVGLAVVALLALFVLSRRSELIRLREQVAQALALEARQRALYTHQHAEPHPSDHR